ncbi:MAG: hypothetical protein C5B55_00450 [Blastocatellia bacterium]|nr:MAG: hypothetical protein C5B55_00450 [Blastocatellia bacterium]
MEHQHRMRRCSPFLLFTTILTCLLLVVFASGSPATKRTPVQVYNKYCVECHGTDGRAKTRKAKFNHARDIADPKWQDDVTDERIYNSIMNGRNVRGNMPAFSKKITDQEADDLVTYVRQLRK